MSGILRYCLLTACPHPGRTADLITTEVGRGTESTCAVNDVKPYAEDSVALNVDNIPKRRITTDLGIPHLIE